MDYSDRLRSLRDEKGATQQRIAKLLNVGQKTYSDYELKRIRIPLDSLIILARFYDVSMDYICGVCNLRLPFPKE